MGSFLPGVTMNPYLGEKGVKVAACDPFLPQWGTGVEGLAKALDTCDSCMSC